MINFMQIAAGFGLQACDLNNEVDPQAALQAIIDRPGPALIHVRIDAQQKVYPMVPPVRPILKWWGISHAKTM